MGDMVSDGALFWAEQLVWIYHQATNQGSLDWGIVDTALYNEALTGWARLNPRCCYCLSDTHSSTNCPQASSGPWHSKNTAIEPYAVICNRPIPPQG